MVPDENGRLTTVSRTEDHRTRIDRVRSTSGTFRCRVLGGECSPNVQVNVDTCERVLKLDDTVTLMCLEMHRSRLADALLLELAPRRSDDSLR